jgi:hypothetical protein
LQQYQQMKRLLLHLLLAFSLLNQSIDVDYSISHVAKQSAEYDDIDSIWELLVEKITDDDDLLSENDDDSGIPDDKTPDKDNLGLQFYQEINDTCHTAIKMQPKQVAIVMEYNIICKGHLLIISPPPDSCS